MKERVFVFRAVEREIVGAQPGLRILDVGCGPGDNLRRLARYGGRPTGIDPNGARLREARALAPVAAGVGEALPFTDASFDMVYVSHVLHHSRDVHAVLRESWRVLAPGGLLFLIETIDDSPLMRLARAVQPRWDEDDVLTRFRYRDLVAWVEASGFRVQRGAKFNWMYFAWELLPLAFRPFELLTPLAIGIEVLFAPLLRPFGGHCWLHAQKAGPSSAGGAAQERSARPSASR
jgi:SAM-dependent methyltransferase